MSPTQLAAEIETLPASLQEQVRDFVAFLKARHPQPEPPLLKREFGAGKDLIIMADDFDAPLEDFNEHR